jgi:hypothetical protein
MQTKELYRATMEVASTRDTRGTATANDVKCSLRTRKGRNLWRITCSIPFGTLIGAGLFIALAPMSLRADSDEGSRPRREDDDRGIRAEIAALRAQVTSLQIIVSTLQSQVHSLQDNNTTLQTHLAVIQSNHALLLGPFVSVDPNPQIGVIGPNIIFTGANIHIVSGSGRTDDNGNCTGLGNLIIGYDEDPAMAPLGMQPPLLGPLDRAGSHNLVLGPFNQFSKTAFGGLVAGEANIISNAVATVTGGNLNAATGPEAAVTGGQANIASGWAASVSGGDDNTASGLFASVSGGLINTASGGYATVSGGELNISSAGESSVLGGVQNTANFFQSVVIGGHEVTNNNIASIAPQPPFP